MSPPERDEEKALLSEPYYDDDQQLKASDEPPRYATEVQDDNVDPSAERKARKKRCFRKLGRHLAIFAVLYFGWQMFFRRQPSLGHAGCGWEITPGSKSQVDDVFRLDERPKPSPDEFPWPPQLTVEECVKWSEHDPHDDAEHGHRGWNGRHGHEHGHDHPRHEHSLDSSFSLPASSDALGLFARGPWSVGHLNVEQGSEETDQVLINVTTKWHGPERLLNLVQLCKFKGGDKELGVGIVSKKGHRHPHGRHHHHIRFDVNVILPRSSDKRLELNKFVTWMPVFSQSFGRLDKGVHFDTIGVFGSVSSIQVESLSARNATVAAAVGSIKGNFSTSEYLKLATASGEIDVNVGLHNDDKSEKWTHLDLRTAVSAIKANVSMFTDSSDSGGKFNITSGFKSGSVNLNTFIGPPKSTVNLAVAGGVGAIDVAMHKLFEGKFNAVTSPFSSPTIVKPKEEEEDGKERKIDFEKVGKGAATGSVWWEAGDGDDSGRERGTVELVNSFGAVTLKL
ncbi:hypothetical protein AAF712_007571 [Marasmius tenuissimus]|uniref:Uncharacterized protein n=1 Tax=Marasmius tenuissimus TaxID=585030 RepID=A0ABR2ZUZ3_9AGAR